MMTQVVFPFRILNVAGPFRRAAGFEGVGMSGPEN